MSSDLNWQNTVSRLMGEKAELQARVDELEKLNHSLAEKGLCRVGDFMRLEAQLTTARNDALEEAAGELGGMGVFSGDDGYGPRIRALKIEEDDV